MRQHFTLYLQNIGGTLKYEELYGNFHECASTCTTDKCPSEAARCSAVAPSPVRLWQDTNPSLVNSRVRSSTVQTAHTDASYHPVIEALESAGPDCTCSNSVAMNSRCVRNT